MEYYDFYCNVLYTTRQIYMIVVIFFINNLFNKAKNFFKGKISLKSQKSPVKSFFYIFERTRNLYIYIK